MNCSAFSRVSLTRARRSAVVSIALAIRGDNLRHRDVIDARAEVEVVEVVERNGLLYRNRRGFFGHIREGAAIAERPLIVLQAVRSP